MKKQSLITLVCVLFSIFSNAQRNNYVELSAGFGDVTSLSAQIVKPFLLGKKEKLIIGPGFRVGYGNTNNFIFFTAPAKLTSDEKNMDTLNGFKGHFISANLTLNLGYQITKSFQLGFNIDVFGISFGNTSKSTYLPNANARAENRVKSIDNDIKPSSPNVLLVGDNDKGTLLSEFYLKYRPSERISIKGFMGLNFYEVSTKERIGVNNNYRFRYKANLFGMGVAYHFD